MVVECNAEVWLLSFFLDFFNRLVEDRFFNSEVSNDGGLYGSGI